MPKITRPLHDNHFSIVRRVVLQLARHTLEEMGIDYPVQIQYQGESEVLATYGSEYNHNTPDTVNFGNGDILTVEMRETLGSEQVGMFQVGTNQYPPIWKRGEYDAELSVDYLPVEWTLSMRYKAKTPERAQMLRSEMAKRISWQRTTVLHAVDYLLTPHKDILLLLRLFHAMENKVYPDGLSDFDWLKKYSSHSSVDLMGNQLHNGKVPVFKELQVELLGNYELTEVPEKELRSQTSGAEIDIELLVRWSRPDGMTLRYPVTIFNEKIPNKYIPRVEHTRSGLKPNTTYERLHGLLINTDENLYKIKNMSFTRDHGIVVPIGDDWIMGAHRWLGKPVFTALVKIKEDHPKSPIPVANHNDVTTFLKMGKGLTRYLKADPRRLVRGYDSVLSAYVANGGVRIDPNHILIDKDLNIKMHFPVTRKSIIHVSYAVPIDMGRFSQQFYNEICVYPDMLEEMLNVGPLDIRAIISQIEEYLYRTQTEAGKGHSRSMWRELRYPHFRYVTAGAWDDIEFGLMFNLKTFLYSVGVRDQIKTYLALHHPDIVSWESISDKVNMKFNILQGFKHWVMEWACESIGITPAQFWGKLDVSHVIKLFNDPLRQGQKPIESYFESGHKTVMKHYPITGGR